MNIIQINEQRFLKPSNWNQFRKGIVASLSAKTIGSNKKFALVQTQKPDPYLNSMCVCVKSCPQKKAQHCQFSKSREECVEYNEI